MIDLREYLKSEDEELARAAVIAPDDIPILPADGYQPRRGLIPLDNDFNPDQERTDPVPLEAARQQISRTIWEYCQLEEPRHMLLIPAPAGFGKTYIGARTAERLAAHRRRVFYAGPRHDFFNDVQREAQRPHLWYPWQPRQLGDSDKGITETCYQKNSMDIWLARGYRSRDFCGIACQWDYADNHCPYYQQRHLSHPIIYGMHEHLWLGHLLMKSCSVVIGDEYPIKESTSMHRWAIPSAFVNPINRLADWDNPMMSILLYIEKMVEATIGKEAEEKAIEITAALIERMKTTPQALLATLDNVVVPTGDIKILMPRLTNPNDPEKVAKETPYAHFVPLVVLLRAELARIAEGKPYNPRVIAKQGGLHLLTNRPLNKDVPRHIVWLDATANAHLYEIAFGRPVEIAEIEVERKGRIFQVWNRAYGMAELVPEVNKKEDGIKKAKLHQAQAVQEIRAIIAKHNYKNIGVFSYEKYVPYLKERLTERIGYFYANRGTNKYSDVDALFVVGTPQPNHLSMVEQAKMIWADRDQPFDPVWSDRPHQYPRQRYAYPKSGFWHDKALSALLWQLRDAEIIQTVNRARILTRDVDVWLLSNLPIAQLPPTELVSLQSIFDVPSRDMIYEVLGREGGFDVHLWGQFYEVAWGIAQKHGNTTLRQILASNDIKISERCAKDYWRILETLWEEDEPLPTLKPRRGRPPKALRPHD